MSEESLVDDEGDRVQCRRCTCLPLKKERSDAAIQCQFHHKDTKNWEKWIAERKRIHENLAKSLDRPSGDLLMNVSDEYRRIQEEKAAFEYSKINTYFDKYRGNPTFWKVPVGLAEKGDTPTRLNTVYFAHKTKIECNQVPLIEHVNTPNYIKAEKDIFPGSRTLFTTHHLDKYKDKLLRPDCNELIIIGEKVPLSETAISSANDVKDELATATLSKTEIQQGTPKEESTLCILVNGIVASNKEVASNIKINLFFVYTLNSRMPEVKFLKFENKCETAIRLNWKRSKKFLLFRKLLKDSRSECFPFYFNKNELLLAPDETIDFPIWFKFHKIGNYSEMWQITTKPRIWKSNIKLIINLQGIVYPEYSCETLESIKETLTERVTKTSVRGVINDIIQYLKFKETESQTFTFTEKQLFECANQNMSTIEKRPKFLYNKNVVKQLRLFYKDIKLPWSLQHWDYSIEYLKVTARMRDIWSYVENQTMDMMKGKCKRMEVCTVIEENIEDQSLMAERDTTILVEGTTETFSQRLDMLLKGLERPAIIANTERLKYSTAYSVIRTYVFKMIDILVDEFDNISSIGIFYPSFRYQDIHDIAQLPDRLIFERFDDIWMDRAKLSSAQTQSDLSATPKPEDLKNIPMTNTELVHKTYFSTGEFEKKDSRKSRGTSIAETQLSSVRPAFDPFQENYTCLTYPEQTYSWKTYQLGLNEYDYHRYLIVYSLINEAVCAMVDALETLKENIIDQEPLRELIKCADSETKNLLFFQEESHIESEKVVEGSITSGRLEQDAYFQSLLDNHLRRNIHTKEYIVEGKRRKQSRDDNSQPNFQGIDTDSLDSWIFESHESVVETIKSTASAEMQTDAVDLVEIPSIISQTETNVSKKVSVVEETPTQDIFYIIEEG